MIDRKHRKLKRHPLVRFIRGIVRLFKVIFTAKKHRQIHTIDRTSEPETIVATDRTSEPETIVAIDSQSDSRTRDKLLTVGEVFDRVNWQLSEQPQTNISVADRSLSAYDVSRN